MLRPLYNNSAHLYLIDKNHEFCQSLINGIGRQGLFIKIFCGVKHFISWIDYEQLPGNVCVLSEADLPEMSGLDLLQVLRADSVVIPTILMSHQPSIQTVVEAMTLGAAYFIEKSSGCAEFASVITHILCRKDTACANDFQEIKQRFNTLSARQKQILRCVFRGEINKRIAGKLNISIKTVELHRALMMKKMQANSISQLIQMVVLIDQTIDHSIT